MVLDIPLLDIVTTDRFQFDAIVVVDVPEDVAVARLVAQRGFTEEDARARVAAQISREERRRTGRPGPRQQRGPRRPGSGDRPGLGMAADRAGWPDRLLAVAHRPARRT